MHTRTSTRTPIYPHKERAHDRAIEKLEAWQGNQENKRTLQEFARHLAVKRDKKRRIMKLIPELIKLSDWLKKDLKQTTYQDHEFIISEIQTNNEWSEPTKSDYVRAWKTLFFWLEDIDERHLSRDPEQQYRAQALYRYLHKHVKTTYKKKDIDFSLILNDEDFHILIANCRTPLEACVIAILYFLGLRAYELLCIRIMDITIEEKCGLIRVNGKTGQRRVPILEAIPYIMNWLNHHPDKNNPEALLLVSLNNHYQYQPLRYVGLVKMLQRIYENAGYLIREEPTQEQITKKIKPKIKYLKKPCTAKWFRHSRATLWAPLFKESVLCNLMGWVQGSEQAKTYVHMGASQVKEAFLQANGLENTTPKAPDITKCICGEFTLKTDKYCRKCFRPLSIDIVMKDEEQKKQAINEAFELLSQIMTDPERKRRFEEFNTPVKFS